MREDGNLPADVTSFVGRRTELAALRKHLSAARLVTLTGPGGVGKTRLALKAASQARRAFPSGVWLVELADLDDPALVPEAVATALGVSKQTTRAPLSQLHHHLADRLALIVLDNCEHLSGACARLVNDVLRGAPGVRFLVTSRQSLGLLGERVFTVPPLSLPRRDSPLRAADLDGYDSVALFCERAADSAPDFTVSDGNAAAVARLCARLDGIPLAIELAAARLPTLSVDDLLARLEHRFQLLVGGNSAALPRQQTLLALIDWSYALCSPGEQALLARLSVFSGSFELAAAEEVCDGGGLARSEILDLLDGLVRKSMVLAESMSGRVRYSLLETIREYGAQQLARTPDGPRLHDSHRDYYVRLVQRSAQEWCGAQQATWLARLRAEHANLRSAFDRAAAVPEHRPMALELAAGLQWHWIAGGSLGEGRRWLGQALACPGPAPPTVVATAMQVDAYLALLHGDLPTAGSRLDEAAVIHQVPQDARLQANLSQLRGMAALFAGDLAAAKAGYEGAMSGYERQRDIASMVSSLFQLAVTYLFSGQPGRAIEACQRSLALSERHGERWGSSYAQWALALTMWRSGDLAAADCLARDSLSVKSEFYDQLGVAHLVELLGWIAASGGEPERSARLLGAASTIWEDLGTSMSAFGPHLAACRQQAEEQAGERMGADRFRAALAAGALLSMEQVIAEILGEGDMGTAGDAADQSPLTARELEVARQVAKGLSNREIAAKLVLSSRTVDSHVQHILTKLSFTSRTQIATWVAEAD